MSAGTRHVQQAARRVVAFGPGRVNLIGEHTDYNDGLSLPFAIADGVAVTATAIDGRELEAIARDLGERDRFKLSRPPRAAGWRAFVRGMVAELQRDGLPVRPARLEIAGTVPQGAGLASSAALEAALALALLELAGATAMDRLRLARLCSRVENDWVGARTGLLDQTASLLGRPGHALRIDFRSMTVAPVPFDLRGWTLVVADSGERHTHASSGYNARRRECAEACRRLGVRSLRDADAGALNRLPPPLDRRARHVVEENVRVERAIKALRRDDLPELARLLDASHASLRDRYEVSSVGVERTVAALRAAGAAGARLVGGGFGGCALGLLPPGVARPSGTRAVMPAAGARLLHG